MSRRNLVLLVKFGTDLSMEETQQIIDSRIDQFRALDGLSQKYCLQESAQAPEADHAVAIGAHAGG